ncbi:AAA family ATPase [Halobaculum sp. MBLA0143]|uniref:AAA family ATPase n=1 Tax=Halobaculum sp. MBLA0143 TaxID=3079933 RepID=UPI003523E57A
MGHVERAEISGFKCLSAVDLECGQLNVLTGRNGTGKTSILEAIQLAHDPTALEAFDPAVGRLIEVGASTASVAVERSDDTLHLSLECVDADTALPLVSEAAVRDGVVLDDTGEQPSFQQELTERSGVATGFEQHLRKSDIDPTDSVVKVETSTFSGKFVSESPEVWMEIHGLASQLESLADSETVATRHPSTGEGFANEEPDLVPIQMVDPTGPPDRSPSADSDLRRVRVRDFLRDHDILPNLESFSFDELVFDEDGEQYAIPYDFLGEGTKTIISLVWQVLSDEEIPDVILLEEPENHLHPGYVKELVEFLIEFARDEDAQLFVTTHNVDFLREFFNDATVGDHETWLGEEFRLIQTTELSPKQFDYGQAREYVEELQLDLRGL